MTSIVKAAFGFECSVPPPCHKCVELYLVFACLSDLQISGTFLEYKLFYSVIKNIKSTIK